MVTDPDDMNRAEVDPFWCEFNEEGSYTLSLDKGEGDETELEEVRTVDDWLHGVIANVRDNVGENNSRVYEVRTLTEERPVIFWGKTHINNQIDSQGLGPGDEIAIRRTGETRDVGKPSPMNLYEVRFKRAGN